LARQQAPATEFQQALGPAVRIEVSQTVSASGCENNCVHLLRPCVDGYCNLQGGELGGAILTGTISPGKKMPG
jgi:hypothetical protein